MMVQDAFMSDGWGLSWRSPSGPHSHHYDAADGDTSPLRLAQQLISAINKLQNDKFYTDLLQHFFTITINFFPTWANARRALTQDDVFSTHVLKRSFRV
eukprot:sb/3478813/